jgi:uncharacterized membrane protein YphA (DoxX/SURF4 family)
MTLRLAQILLALLFILGGLATLRSPQRPAEQLARLRLPVPTFFVRLNAAVMVLAGLALALNIQAAAASMVLVAVLVPTTIAGHAFWNAEGAAREQQLAHFLKNVAVVGGLMALTLAVR